MDSERAALANVVDAWEALPGAENYSQQAVADWLIHEMAPAIARARDVLDREVDRRTGKSRRR